MYSRVVSSHLVVPSLLHPVNGKTATYTDPFVNSIVLAGNHSPPSDQKQVWGGDLVCLYQGAMAAAAATAVGYFPWFLTFNYLNGRVRKPSAMAWMLLRNAAIGLASSVTSDVCSNSIRVLKTTKQAAAAYDAKVTYRGAAALVIEKDGFLVRVAFLGGRDCCYANFSCLSIPAPRRDETLRNEKLRWVMFISQLCKIT